MHSHALLILLMILTLVSIVEVEAGTYTVNTLDDHDDGSCDTDCTLREAINAAQSNCWDAVDLINFDASLTGTIYLSGRLPEITCPMVIDGDSRIAISGSSVDYGLIIYAWDGTSDPDVTVRNLIFEGFTVSGVYAQPSGQILLENLEVRGSGVGVSVYSSISTSKVELRSLSIHNNSQQGIYIAPASSSGETEVIIERSRIYWNSLQGIAAVGTSGGIRNLFIGNLSHSDSGNLVYGNGAEGILLWGVEESRIAYNIVGTDGSSAQPNKLGGITLINASRNEVIGNEVAYNGYQDILLIGTGTSGNKVDGNYVHCDSSLSDPYCYIGIWVGGGASGNEIGASLGNVISGHKYEGIAVVGRASGNEIKYNKIGAFDGGGSYLGDISRGNGAGIAVINAASPEIHYPFPVYAEVSSANVPGPDSTLIQSNEVAGNRGAGIILIRATDFELSFNMIYENSLHGVYWVGSSGAAFSNTVQSNDGSGFRIEPYWGLNSPPGATSPSNSGDDVLSTPTDSNGFGIYGNFIEFNGDHGLLVLDNPWASLEVMGNENFFWGNSPIEAAKLWLGHVRVVDQSGNPLSGVRVEVLRGGDDGDGSADYSCFSGTDGRCGPAGFSYDNASTWFKITEEELLYSSSGDLVVRRYNPHSFSADGVRLSSLYSWNGVRDPGESGYSLESPPGSGALRYQYAELVLAKAPRTEELARACYVKAELNATPLQGYPVSPGKELNYTLKLIHDCDRAIDLRTSMKIPLGLSLEKESIRAFVGRASYDEANGLLLWSGKVKEGITVLSFKAKVDQTYLGNPLKLRANLSCSSPSCIVVHDGSDDPVTHIEGDATVRPVSWLDLYLPLSSRSEVSVNLSEYGNFSAQLLMCGSWLSQFDGAPLTNGSHLVKPIGRLEVLSPQNDSSCFIKFILIEPSDSAAQLLRTKLSPYVGEFQVRLHSFEPEVEVSKAIAQVNKGRPFPLRISIANPGDVELRAKVKIELAGLRLLSVTYAAPGEVSERAERLYWQLELKPRARASAQLILLPELEGRLKLPLEVNYEVLGVKRSMLIHFELEISGEKRNSTEIDAEKPVREVNESASVSEVSEPQYGNSSRHEEANIPVGSEPRTQVNQVQANESAREEGASLNFIMILAPILIIAVILISLIRSSS